MLNFFLPIFSRSPPNVEINFEITMVRSNEQIRSVKVPANRIRYMKENWLKIVTPLVHTYNIQVRMNLATKCVDLREAEGENTTILERSAQFIMAILDNFEISDALLIIETTDTFVDTFNVTDVTRLKRDHLDRAIGRLIGKNGIVKRQIEHMCRIKYVVDGQLVRCLGTAENLKTAKRAFSRLIMGSNIAKVCEDLRNAVSRLKHRSCNFEVITKRLY